MPTDRPTDHHPAAAIRRPRAGNYKIITVRDHSSRKAQIRVTRCEERASHSREREERSNKAIRARDEANQSPTDPRVEILYIIGSRERI